MERTQHRRNQLTNASISFGLDTSRIGAPPKRPMWSDLHPSLALCSALPLKVDLQHWSATIFSSSSGSGVRSSTMAPFAHSCSIDAEPVHRYKAGGYHPIHLGDCLDHGRYKVLHKLGWGGHSTVWAAKDQRLDTYVAVQVSVSERQNGKFDRCLRVTRKLAPSSSAHPGAAFVMQTRDHFTLDGPNGTHECLVLELLGPSVTDVLEVRFRDGRLPAEIARRVARRTLSALDYLHSHGIGHGGAFN